MLTCGGPFRNYMVTHDHFLVKQFQEDPGACSPRMRAHGTSVVPARGRASSQNPRP